MNNLPKTLRWKEMEKFEDVVFVLDRRYEIYFHIVPFYARLFGTDVVPDE